MKTKADASIGDTTGLTVDQQKAVLDTAAASYPSPHIILQHSVKDNTPQVVTYEVPKLQQAGYEMVALDTCMGDTGESFDFPIWYEADS
jgi:hypothetical protein